MGQALDKKAEPMTEQTKIEAAARAEGADAPRNAGSSLPWGPDFAAGEHPDTARHRLQYEYIITISNLSREALDRKYAYLGRLIEKSKEELSHARSASNEVRMAAMQQNIDELVAYVSGHGISAKLPNRNGEKAGANIAHYYVLDEIPAFLGELSFMVDVWYEKGLAKVHDELLKLTGLAARMR